MESIHSRIVRKSRSASPNGCRFQHTRSSTHSAEATVPAIPAMVQSRRAKSIYAKSHSNLRSAQARRKVKRNKRTTRHKESLVGEVVEARIDATYQLGVVRYHGPKLNCKDTSQRVIGLELYKHIGNSDGTWDDEYYFRPKYGSKFAFFCDESNTPVRVVCSSELLHALINATSLRKDLARVNKTLRAENEALKMDVAAEKKKCREFFQVSSEYHGLYQQLEEEKQKLKQQNEDLLAECDRLNEEVKRISDEKFFIQRDFAAFEKTHTRLKNYLTTNEPTVLCEYKNSVLRARSRPRIILPGAIPMSNTQQQTNAAGDQLRARLCEKPHRMTDREDTKQRPQRHLLDVPHHEHGDSGETFIEHDDEEEQVAQAVRVVTAHFRHTSGDSRMSGSTCDDLILRPIHVEDWFTCDSPQVQFRDDRLNAAMHRTPRRGRPSKVSYGQMDFHAMTNTLSPSSAYRRTPVIRRTTGTPTGESVLIRRSSYGSPRMETLDQETSMSDLFDVRPTQVPIRSYMAL